MMVGHNYRMCISTLDRYYYNGQHGCHCVSHEMNMLVLAGRIISGAQQLLDVPSSMSGNQLARLVGCVQACPGLLLVGVLVLVIAATCMAVSIGPCGLARVSMSSLQAGGQPFAQSMLWYQALRRRIA